MTDLGTAFWSMLLLSFGVVVLFSGFFAAYFGAGKSRKIGLGLTLFGLLCMVLFAGFVWNLVPGLADATEWDPAIVMAGVVAVVAAAVGGFLALALFLVSIMKA